MDKIIDNKELRKLNELKDKLNLYKKFLSSDTNKYLTSLINLEISALDESKMNLDDMKMLTTIDLYNQIVRYNIYNKALKMFEKEHDFDILIFNHKGGFKELNVFGLDHTIPEICIFNYDNDNSIDLHQTIHDSDTKNQFISNLKEFNDKNQKELDNEKILDTITKDFDDIFSNSDRFQRHKYYKSMYDDLVRRNTEPLPDNLNYQMQVQKYFIDKIVKEFNIDFSNVENTDKIDFGEYNPAQGRKYYKENSLLTQKLVKKYPNITVTKNIEYY